MGKAKQTRKFAVAKKMISPKDTRVASNMIKAKAKEEQKEKKAEPRQVEQAVSALFFEYNTQLGPPYHVLVDTNFINFSIRYVRFVRAWFGFGAVCSGAVAWMRWPLTRLSCHVNGIRAEKS
jgi:hypothetical protein